MPAARTAGGGSRKGGRVNHVPGMRDKLNGDKTGSLGRRSGSAAVVFLCSRGMRRQEF